MKINEKLMKINNMIIFILLNIMQNHQQSVISNIPEFKIEQSGSFPKCNNYIVRKPQF